MNAQNIKLSIPLTFNQVVEIVKQLSPKDKLKLKEVLQETEEIGDSEIPEEHKNIVRQRIRSSQKDPARILNWNEAKHKLKV